MSPSHSVLCEARRLASSLCLLLSLAACGTHPLPPDWQVEAQSGTDRAVAAYLQGHRRVAELEFDRAGAALSATAQPEVLAQGELLRCAVRLASLELGPCAAFERLRPDSSPAQQAYADYLAGARLQAAQQTLLPVVHQAIAKQLAGTGWDDAPLLARLADAEPLTRLVAAAVVFQAGRASPALVTLAVDTASAQGWRRPLLAWLGVQARLAELAGQTDELQRLRRRMDLLPASD
ncbi:MAG: hypothetical protein RL459_1135 [Pseudomonadota bacterium]